MQPSPLVSFSPSCPSFNAYTSSNLVDIAARVVAEEEEEDFGSFSSSVQFQFNSDHVDGDAAASDQRDTNCNDDDGEFEFSFACCRDSESSSADEIFCNGQIKPVYPLFGTTLLVVEKPKPKSHRPKLGKLLTEERECEASSSSESSSSLGSSSDHHQFDFEGAAPESYCVWTPHARRCEEKTNSSKRWRLRQFVQVSHNKENLAPTPPTPTPTTTTKKSSESDGGGGGGEKRKWSILPYKEDFLGFISNVNVNGLSRNLHPF